MEKDTQPKETLLQGAQKSFQTVSGSVVEGSQNASKLVTEKATLAKDAVLGGAQNTYQTVSKTVVEGSQNATQFVTEKATTAKDAVLGGAQTTKETVVGASVTARDYAVGTKDVAVEKTNAAAAAAASINPFAAAKP